MARYWCVKAVFAASTYKRPDRSSDSARDIYKNATMEKIALLRFLTERERATEVYMRSWEGHLAVGTIFVGLGRPLKCCAGNARPYLPSAEYHRGYWEYI